VTQIDFYILSEDSEDARLRLACRLTEQAMHRKLGVYLLVETEGDARKLDELLWTFSQNSFVPHRLAWNLEAAVEEAVFIGCDGHAETVPFGRPEAPGWDLMINLADAVPESFGRYERLAEVVDAQPTRRELGRERYRYYRDRGYELKTHRL